MQPGYALAEPPEKMPQVFAPTLELPSANSVPEVDELLKSSIVFADPDAVRTPGRPTAPVLGLMVKPKTVNGSCAPEVDEAARIEKVELVELAPVVTVAALPVVDWLNVGNCATGSDERAM
jgi:hypothetical protein